MSRDDWRPETRAVHAGLPPPERGEPFLPGPTFAAPFHLPGDPEGAPYDYGRDGNPTWSRYEAALGELEGGEAVVFSSGMAAVNAALYAFAGDDDARPVVVPADGYFMTRRVAARMGAARGLEVRLVETDTDAIVAALDGARLAIVESPSNPWLDACDIAAVAEAARAAGAVLAVDNTLATPLRQRPLELGAELSLSADTKALTGHADLMMGHAAARDAEHAEALRAWRRQTGSIPGPFEVWLAHRSLATLGVRLDRQERNAHALVELLSAREDVGDVRHPGVAGVMGFDAGGRERAEAFLDACELVIEATSFGGVHTTAERRARWAGDEVPEGWIRLSAGVEDAVDVCSDVARALDATRSG
jgi:cystathionine gamma-lyase